MWHWRVVLQMTVGVVRYARGEATVPGPVGAGTWAVGGSSDLKVRKIYISKQTKGNGLQPPYCLILQG